MICIPDKVVIQLFYIWIWGVGLYLENGYGNCITVQVSLMVSGLENISNTPHCHIDAWSRDKAIKGQAIIAF